MRIPAAQITYRKKIGRAGSRPIYGLGTMGGLHMVVVAKSGGFETLGVGSHPGIARHLATQYSEDVEFDVLEKSEYVDPSCFQDLLPYWSEITTRARQRKL